MSDFVTLKEAARRLSVEVRTLRKYIHRGEIPIYRLGSAGMRGPIRLRWSEVEAWLKSRRVRLEKCPEARQMLEQLFGKSA